jgi:CrcB protein
MSDDDTVVPIDPDLAPAPARAPAGSGARRRRARRRRAQPAVLALVALGGIGGATARYGIVEALPQAAGEFPWATFWTNVAGSFLLGLSMILLLERFPSSRYLRLFLATGVLGSFTTMSTFLDETVLLAKDGHAAVAASYCAATVVVGVTVAYGGIVAARLMPVARRRGR